MASRQLNPDAVRTWEFTVFSQNGEDGIIEHLTSLIKDPNRYFVEIGASDGMENNTAYLALVKRHGGLMVEGSPLRSRYAKHLLGPRCLGVEFVNEMVSAETAPALVRRSRYLDPDFFSIDIDGIDYYVAEAMLEAGFRPKVICAEYNSTFGPVKAVTIPYSEGFDFTQADPTALYYGVSLTGWQNLLTRYGYRFVTVESNGVNAFFVDPDAVDVSGFDRLEVTDWQENCAQWVAFQSGWEGQFGLIQDRPLVAIE